MAGGGTSASSCRPNGGQRRHPLLAAWALLRQGGYRLSACFPPYLRPWKNTTRRHFIPSGHERGLACSFARDIRLWQFAESSPIPRARLGQSGGSGLRAQDGRRHGREMPVNHFQTSSAISFTSLIFAHCSSSVNLLPISQEAKPHCGLRHRRSSGM